MQRIMHRSSPAKSCTISGSDGRTQSDWTPSRWYCIHGNLLEPVPPYPAEAKSKTSLKLAWILVVKSRWMRPSPVLEDGESEMVSSLRTLLHLRFQCADTRPVDFQCRPSFPCKQMNDVAFVVSRRADAATLIKRRKSSAIWHGTGRNNLCHGPGFLQPRRVRLAPPRYYVSNLKHCGFSFARIIFLRRDENSTMLSLMVQRKSKVEQKKTKSLHVELPPEIEGYIRSMAEIQDRSVRNMVLVLLKQALRANGVKL